MCLHQAGWSGNIRTACGASIMYDCSMAKLVQIRDVPDEVVSTLRTRAAEEGMTFSSFVRQQLARIAERPTNAQIVDRLAALNRDDKPTVSDIVAEIRKDRDR